MLIAWTTVPTKDVAETIATGAVHAGHTTCVQVEGPITSHYIWEGRQEKTEEYRLTFKLLPEQLTALEAWLNTHHPYQVPEWVVVKADHVAEKYLSWARAVRSN